jgi:hypothetical protein
MTNATHESGRRAAAPEVPGGDHTIADQQLRTGDTRSTP